MTDKVAPEVRSRMMAAVRGKDTKPELAVRKGLHALGFRYSLHSGKLPGKPDLLLPKHQAALWVHGCFWHGHGCPHCRPAQSRTEFWGPKVERTRERDAQALEAAKQAGWRRLVIWECALAVDTAGAVERTAKWLRSAEPEGGISGYSSGSSAPSSTASSSSTSGTALPAK